MGPTSDEYSYSTTSSDLVRKLIELANTWNNGVNFVYPKG